MVADGRAHECDHLPIGGRLDAACHEGDVFTFDILVEDIPGVGIPLAVVSAYVPLKRDALVDGFRMCGAFEGKDRALCLLASVSGGDIDGCIRPSRSMKCQWEQLRRKGHSAYMFTEPLSSD